MEFDLINSEYLIDFYDNSEDVQETRRAACEMLGDLKKTMASLNEMVDIFSDEFFDLSFYDELKLKYKRLGRDNYGSKK